MKLTSKICLCMLVWGLAACGSLHKYQSRDNMGRIATNSIYRGNDLIYLEKITYLKKTTMPRIIRYYQKKNGELRLYKSEEYSYRGKILVGINFFVYKKNKKKATGAIQYFFWGNRLSRIEYYSYGMRKKKIGLDYFRYIPGKEKISSRRIILLHYNPSRGKTEQTAQYFIHYRFGEIHYMKVSHMSKDSTKLIVTKYTNPKRITKMIEKVSKKLKSRARGREYTSM